MNTPSTATGAHDDADHVLLHEANSLLERLSKSKLGERAEVLAAKVRDGADYLKAKSAEASAIVKAKAAEAQKQVAHGVEVTEGCIKENPWTSVGIAAGVGLGVGLAVGLLIRRD